MTDELARGITRRQFGAIAGGTLAAIALSAATRGQPRDDPARIKARPKPGVKTAASGEHALGLADPRTGRDALLRIPPKAGSRPLPLMVLFHGAGSSAEIQLHRFGTEPEDAGLAVLALDSRGITWDGIREGFGPDIAFLERALAYTFSVVDVDPARVIAGGFSDGATYALALGLINGDFFSRIVACSPGFLIPVGWTGKPKVFISHGTADPILPIEQCSRKIVPVLRENGYDVTFKEFDGGHMVPSDIVHDAMRWAAAPIVEHGP